jgi:hypothetical protein
VAEQNGIECVDNGLDTNGVLKAGKGCDCWEGARSPGFLTSKSEEQRQMERDRSIANVYTERRYQMKDIVTIRKEHPDKADALQRTIYDWIEMYNRLGEAYTNLNRHDSAERQHRVALTLLLFFMPEEYGLQRFRDTLYYLAQSLHQQASKEYDWSDYPLPDTLKLSLPRTRREALYVLRASYRTYLIDAEIVHGSIHRQGQRYR